MDAQLEQFSHFKETLLHLKGQKLSSGQNEKVSSLEKEIQKQGKRYEQLMAEYKNVPGIIFKLKTNI